jgi:hypothetical protein
MQVVTRRRVFQVVAAVTLIVPTDVPAQSESTMVDDRQKLTATLSALSTQFLRSLARGRRADARRIVTSKAALHRAFQFREWYPDVVAAAHKGFVIRDSVYELARDGYASWSMETKSQVSRARCRGPAGGDLFTLTFRVVRERWAVERVFMRPCW